ncbi:thioesterase II family protein [Streptomyces sp. NPDC050433]|uniref:thioesterase II family protein n=1 Tax=Streptomyces sp. NPDC050433 TaxID=3365615 RepID=UPI00378F9845
MSSGTSDVFLFPGAGSFGSELQPLLRALGPSARSARYPGRFGRDFGRAATSFAAVVKSCVDLITTLQPLGAVLVGHSYGAYVAYVTATELEAIGARASALVVTGATAPALLTIPESITQSSSDAAAYLDHIDPGLFSDESGDWRDIVIETAMQDLTLLREFTQAAYPRVRCPVFAARGEEDLLAPSDGIQAWVRATTEKCTHRSFPGGHSDLLRSSEFAAWLDEIRA